MSCITNAVLASQLMQFSRPSLVQSVETMRCLFDSMLALTKQDRLCHVIHATNDPFYYSWLRQLNVIQHCKVGLAIRIPLNIENTRRLSQLATVLSQRCAHSFSSVFCHASQNRFDRPCPLNFCMRCLEGSWPIGKILLTIMVRGLAQLRSAYNNFPCFIVNSDGNFDSMSPGVSRDYILTAIPS